MGNDGSPEAVNLQKSGYQRPDLTSEVVQMERAARPLSLPCGPRSDRETYVRVLVRECNDDWFAPNEAARATSCIYWKNPID
jgi:hypothetical protein